MDDTVVGLRRSRRAALLAALLGILIISSGLFCTDYMDYRRYSISLEFVRDTPQIHGSHFSDEETTASIEEALSNIRSRMSIDAAIVLLAFFSLWCIREVKSVRKANGS